MNVSPQTYEATLTLGSAQVTGNVTDPTGAPVQGTIVRAYDAGGVKVAEVRTNEAGVYELALADGSYRLEFQQTGFQSTS